MPSQPLHQILNSFSKTEKLRFRDFVSSPFFNKSADVIDFLNIVVDAPEICDEDCYAKLYPGKAYVQRRIIDLSYRLACLAEEFLGQIEAEATPFDRKIKLLRSVQSRKIEKAIRALSASLQEDQQRRQVRDSEYYLDEYLLQTELDKSFAESGKLEKDISLQRKNDSLDLFYIASKLRDCCEMLNRTQIIQSEYSIGLIDEILHYIQERPQIALQHPVINIYYHIYNMLSRPEQEDIFKNLLQLLAERGNLFSNDELRGMYNYAQNYCIRKVNSGNNDFYRPLFDINRQLLDRQLIFLNGQLTQRDYKNITSIALRLGEYDWTLNFINEYKSKLPKDQKENAYTYNLANYCYETGDRRKAVRLLREVEFTDIFYSLDAKVMLLKIYYELEEDEAFLSLAASFKIFLTRTRLINENTRNLYMNLLVFTSKLYSMRLKHIFRKGKAFQAKLKELKDKTENNAVANSRWLIGKIEELIIF